MMKKFALLLGLILGLGLSAQAQTTVALMPIPKPQFFGQNGLPLAGCKIFTYQSGTSTPQGTFFDSGGTIANPNPVTCDAGGFVSIWLIVGDTYRILVQDQNGVQQYLTDGVVGVGGGTLSLFSTPNTWTALQSFPGGINASGGGTFSGTFTGSPSFSGTPQFTTFTISNSTVIANLNASLWNGTSINAGGALTTGFVPVVSAGGAATWNNLPSIAGVATLSQLPGSGITTINGIPCTLGASCLLGSIAANVDLFNQGGNVAATTIYAVPLAATGFYQITCYLVVTRAATTTSTLPSCAVTWTDPDTSVVPPAATFTCTNAGNTVGTAGYATSGPCAISTYVYAKGGTNIQYALSNYASSGATSMQYAAHLRVAYEGN